jgi:large subunit ribosomal protein L18
MKEKTKIKKRVIRKKRTRSKIYGTNKRPRLSVYRSNRYTSAQLIDDDKGTTMVSVSEKDIKAKSKKLQGKAANALELGLALAEKALKKNIKSVVFDKGGNKYHGRVKQVAEGARKGGLKL